MITYIETFVIILKNILLELIKINSIPIHQIIQLMNFPMNLIVIYKIILNKIIKIINLVIMKKKIIYNLIIYQSL